MGAIKPQQEPEMPQQLFYLYEAYRSLKFAKTKNKDNDPNDENSPKFLLIPRKMLNYIDVSQYSLMSGYNFEQWEIEAIMSIDIVFHNGRGE